MKKILSVLLSLAVLLSVTGVSAFAATSSSSGVTKPKRVKIETAQKWVRVGRSIQLDAAIYPADYEYDSIEWYTLDYDLVEIDSYGEVTGLKPGTAHIAMYVYADGPTRKVEVGSAEIEIEVRASLTSSYSFDDTKYDPDSRALTNLPTPSGSPSTIVEKKGTIPTKTVNEAVKKALVAGTTADTTFKNYTSISTISLESAAADMQLGGGVVLLNFDTIAVNGSTEGRLTINPRAYKPVQYADPLQVGHSIDVTVNTNNDDVFKVKDKFQKYFKNDIIVIKMGQKGGYGMNVTCTVKAGDVLAKAKQSNLKLYTFDPDKGDGGTYKLIKNPNISIDSKKNLQFTTNTGNYLIISNGTLTKKQ